MSSSSETPSLLCLIPARGGSKRIPRKNIRSFAGRPMIAWSIEKAIKTSLFQDIVVSTDDLEIASISQAFGAWIPFMRESELSDDFSSTGAVTFDALSRLSQIGRAYDYVCCLYPTAVFTSTLDLISSYQTLVRAGCSTCLAVTSYSFSPFRALVTGQDDRLHFAYAHYQNSRTQDLPQALHDAGQFCWSRTRDLLASGSVEMNNVIGHMMKKGSVIDIDDEDDLRFAEQLFLHTNRTNRDGNE
jgi:pseudaminic acid cytidylyltransferase